MEIKRDGQVVEFGKKDAPFRALLALALLRNRVDFTVEEFEMLYLGKASDDPGHTFNNAKNEWRPFFPNVSYRMGRGGKRSPARHEAVDREAGHCGRAVRRADPGR